jgi:hypothetical protein
VESRISSFPQKLRTAGPGRTDSGAPLGMLGSFRQTARDGVSEITSLILLAKIKLVRFAKIAR